MEAAPTIGDLISEALKNSTIVREAEIAWQEAEHARMVLVGRFVAAELATHYQLQFDEVWNALGHVPGHMLGMLETPYGWTVLGEYVAQSLGLTGSVPLMPAIH